MLFGSQSSLYSLHIYRAFPSPTLSSTTFLPYQLLCACRETKSKMSFRGNDKGKKGFLGFSMGNRSKEKLEKASSGSQAPRNTDVIQHKWSKLYAALLRRPVDNDLLEMANEFASVAVPGPHIKTRAIGSLTHDEVLGIFPWKKDTSYNWNLRPNEMTPVVPAGLGIISTLSLTEY